MLFLRSALFNVLFYSATAAALIFGAPMLLARPGVLVLVSRIWARSTFWLLRHIVGLDWEIRGPAESLNRPVLVAAKHQSAWDTMVFLILADGATYVMKKELLSIPIFGWMARHAGHIPIDRAAGAAAMRRLMRAARASLDGGRTIVLFPQGTRVAPGQAAPYQPGIVALYQSLGVPLVPVALNSGLYWGRRRFIKRPGKIVLEVLPELPAGLDRKQLQRELESRIEVATARLEAEGRAAAGIK